MEQHSAFLFTKSPLGKATAFRLGVCKGGIGAQKDACDSLLWLARFTGNFIHTYWVPVRPRSDHSHCLHSVTLENYPWGLGQDSWHGGSS